MSSCNQDLYLEVLGAACQAEGVKLELMEQGWIKRLEQSGQVAYIAGYKFPLNSQAAGAIADDKFATFEVLSRAGLPIIPHYLLYAPGNTENYARGLNTPEYVEKILAKCPKGLVVKPNHGTLGRDVCLLRAPAEIPAALQAVFRADNAASLTPFLEIAEKVRCVLIDGELMLIFRRERNDDWTGDWKLGYKIHRIDHPGDYDELIEIAREAMAAIKLRMGSVDFVREKDGTWQILEVNSGVMLENYLEAAPKDRERVENIYRTAIRKSLAERGQ